MSHVRLPLTPEWLWWPQPWVWLLLLLLVLPMWHWWWRDPRRGRVLRFSGLEAVRAAGSSWRVRMRPLLGLLRLAALAALIVAAARPQSPSESRRQRVEGIAIQMVLDVSGSMLDLDLSPPGQRVTRLDVVKEIFRRFVVGDGDRLPGRPNDLIGMIRFARFADSVCPLTLDREHLERVLHNTEIPLDRFQRVPEEYNQTAIGDGLALAVERLRELKRVSGSGAQFVIKSRVVILLTDGENNAGMITPEQAGELAAKYGIRVYTIAAGTGQQVGFGRLPVDDRVLQEIARVTGGKHFRAGNAQALLSVYGEIDQLERTTTEEHAYVDWRDLGFPLALAAFACLGLQSLLGFTLLRKLP